jgi:transposase
MSDEFDLKSELSRIKDREALEVVERIVAHFTARISKLEQQVAELSRNSSTSSKPPSSDITKPRSEQRRPGERQRGGQPGRDGKARVRFEKHEIDRTEELSLSHCPDCGEALSEEKQDVVIHQIIELPEKPVEVLEYHQVGKECRNCQAYQYKRLPEGVVEGQLFGVRFQALIGYMKGAFGVSYTELERFCCDVLKIKVSRGMLCNVVDRNSAALEVPYEELKDSIPQQKQLNIDETGWRDSGKGHWVWVFCNKLIAFFTISTSRGSQVLKSVLGDNFAGALTTDFFSAYISYASEKQQFCLAHLIRDIKFLTMLPDTETQVFGKKLLRYFRHLFRLWHKRETYNTEVFKKKIAQIKTSISNHIANSSFTRGAKAHTMQRRILKRWKGLFLFAEHPNLYQPTNNEAERTLRHIIRIRRQTQGSVSDAGQRWNERIATTIETCKKQNRSPWTFLVDSLFAFYHSKNYPAFSTT